MQKYISFIIFLIYMSTRTILITIYLLNAVKNIFAVLFVLRVYVWKIIKKLINRIK